MNNGLIAARYATALMEFVPETASRTKLYQEAKAVSKSFLQFRELRLVLENPVMGKAEKRKVIDLAAGGNSSKSFARFVDVLLDNNREIHLQSIMLKFMDLYRKANNIHSGKLTTAYPIEALVEKRLLDMIQKNTGGTLEIEKQVDPSILGGFQFEVDFVRWDASLSGQLQSIRSEYIEQNKKVL